MDNFEYNALKGFISERQVRLGAFPDSMAGLANEVLTDLDQLVEDLADEAVLDQQPWEDLGDEPTLPGQNEVQA